MTDAATLALAIAALVTTAAMAVPLARPDLFFAWLASVRATAARRRLGPSYLDHLDRAASGLAKGEPVDPLAPPRSLSIDDIGFDQVIGAWLVVSMNGTPVSGCVGYDVDAGVVMAYRFNQVGRVVVNPRTRGPAVDRLKGDVSVAWRNGQPPPTLRVRLAPPGG